MTPLAKIQIHDFAGHPFQAQLSRELARRGYEVDHAYSAQYASGKGRLTVLPDDPQSLRFTAIEAPREFAKYDPIGRLRFEQSYSRAWIAEVQATRPELVIACNVPLFVLQNFSRFARRKHLPWMLWHQDIFSLALTEELHRKFPRPVAALGGAYVTRVERGIVDSATRVVAIGDEFLRQYETWGARVDHAEVIPNWAPVDEITPQPRDNPWSATHLGPGTSVRLVYAGTLGRKHNPELLVQLLDAATARGLDVELVVISEGEGAEHLRVRATERPDLALRVFGFQPAEELPLVLGSADVVVAILEPEASTFSIPSKVLSYLAAGRAVLGLMPDGNPAAGDIREAGGCVAPPTEAGVATAVDWLADALATPGALAAAGTTARSIAVERFGIGAIGDKFEAAIGAALHPSTALHDAQPALHDRKVSAS